MHGQKNVKLLKNVKIDTVKGKGKRKGKGKGKIQPRTGNEDPGGGGE